MKTLNNDWFYTNRIDFEYKKYVLLAYLKDVQQSFNQTKLYPPLAELVQHYKNLVLFKQQKDSLQDNFKEKLVAFNFEAFKLAYEKVVSDDTLMQTLEEIIGFSIPKIKKLLEEGKEIYDFIEHELAIEPVGVLPLYQKEGYLLVYAGNNREVKVYEYAVKLFERNHEKYRSISTQPIDSYTKNLINTSENIKLALIRKHKKLPNPATFSVVSKHFFPLEETLLHIAKRKLVASIIT